MRASTWNQRILACLLASTPLLAQQTESGQAAAQDNRGAGAQEAAVATLEVKPGPPALKTKDIQQERKITPWKRLPGYILQDQKAIWTSPFRTSRSDAKWWAIVGGATAALIASDHWTAKQLPNTSDQMAVAKWTSTFGGAAFLLPASGAFYFAGLGAHNDRFRETGLLGFEALADTEAVVAVAKFVTRRERPLEGDGGGSFWGSKATTWNSGFPSGHAINSWALASIVAHEYPRPLIVPIMAYGLAATVVGSRFAARQHFASDVVLGAALGWFIGDFVYAKRHNRELDKPSALERIASHVHLGGPPISNMPADPEAEKASALRLTWPR